VTGGEGAPKTTAHVVFLIVCAGVVLATLDQFVVNIAFPSIEQDLDASVSTVSWVLNAYAIVFAALLVPFGRLADRSGRARGFLIGVATFTAASALCAAAPGIGWLIAARILQAAGAAMLIPCSLGLALAAYPISRRTSIVRRWSVVTSLSAAAGPVVGGLLVSASWRWVFVINLPIGVLALLVGRKRLPRVEPEPGPWPDLLGGVLLAIAVGSLSLGIVQGHEWGWTSAAFLSTLGIAIVVGAWFVVRSSRHPSPVIELPLLRVPVFRGANIALLVNSVGMGAMLLATFLAIQDVWGWGPLKLGIAYLPAPLMVPPCAWLSGRLLPRVGAGPIACAGGLIHSAAALLFFTSFGSTPEYLTVMLPNAILTGIGVGLVMPTLLGAGSTALPIGRLATGSGVLTMARQIGFSVGVAVLVAILAAPVTGTADPSTFKGGWLMIASASACGGVAALLVGGAGRHRPEHAPHAVPQPAGSTSSA
jgi:EmrB/QacA subfamily drug resistance transporter